jgi:type II secretory pathway predicted ATPase ExeA
MSERNVDDFILANMPHFIAVNYARLLKTPTAQERVTQALYTYNLGLRALTISLVNQYLVRDSDNVSDPYLDNLLLRNFPHLTPDAWQQLLFATLRVYIGQRELFFVSELYDFYWDTSTWPHRQRSGVEQLFERLTQLSVEQQAQLLIRDAAGWEVLAAETLDLLRQLLADMAFIGNYDLIHMLDFDDQYYEFELHKGVEVTYGHAPRPVGITLDHGVFYLRKSTRELFPLHPLLVFWNKELDASDRRSVDIGVYEDFIYERLRYLLATLRQTVTDDRHLTAFVAMLYDTIEVKHKLRPAEKLTWWQLRDICTDITQNRMAAVREKYRRDLYLQRDKTHQAFENFLRFDKRCFVLIGKSGVGKSNCFLALSEQFQQLRDDVCMLMYDGAKMDMRLSVTAIIDRDVARRFSLSARPMETVWQEINRIEAIEQRLVILWVDAINENPHARELLRQLDELAQEGWPWLKIVFSSRPETWRTIKRGVKLAEALYYRAEGSESLGVELEPFSYSEQMEPFSRHELPAAYARYQQVFELRTDYNDLPAPLRETLRDPLSLWLVANTYQRQAIPSTVKVTELIERYIQALVERDVLREEDLQFLERRLVPLMVYEEHYRNTITPGELKDAGDGRYEAVYSEQVLSDGQRMNQSFISLVDTEILIRQEQGREQHIAFKYERFYEYFVGRRILELSEALADRPAFFVNMIGQIADTPFLWGAIKQALIQEARDRGSETIKRLCLTNQQRVKELIVSVMTDLGADDRAQVEAILETLLPPIKKIGTIQQVRQLLGKTETALDQSARYAGRIAIEVASNLRIAWILQVAALQTDSTFRATAVRYIYYLWQRNSSVGFDILEHIAMNALQGRIPNLIAFEPFLGLSLIILFNHPHDTPTVKRLQIIWRGVIAKVLSIRETHDHRENAFRGFVRDRIFSFVITFIFQVLRDFPQYIPDVSYIGLSSFFNLNQKEKALYRNLVQYLDIHGDYSRTQMELDFLEALKIRSLLVEVVAVMGLIVHSCAKPLEFLSFLKVFFNKAQKDPSPSEWSSYILEILSKVLDDEAKQDEIFNFFVDTMKVCHDYYAQNFQNIGSNRSFYASKAMYLATYLVNQYRRRSGTTDTEWLRNRIQEEIPNKNTLFFERLIKIELAVIGIEIREPKIALESLDLLFNTGEEEVDSMVISLLARMRTYYPDDVEDFLEEHQASDRYRLQVRTNEPVEGVGALIGIKFWRFVRDDMLIGSPILRSHLMRVLTKAADCKDIRTWMNYLLREVINLVYGGEALRQTQ